MQDMFCLMFYISCKSGPNLCLGAETVFVSKKSTSPCFQQNHRLLCFVLMM